MYVYMYVCMNPITLGFIYVSFFSGCFFVQQSKLLNIKEKTHTNCIMQHCTFLQFMTTRKVCNI